MSVEIMVGVLALQGAFHEHLVLFQEAAASHDIQSLGAVWTLTEVRTSQELSQCDALVIPGGESTTMALVASRSDLLERLRHFVKSVSSVPSLPPPRSHRVRRVERRPTWGTCAGMILLAEAASRTKKGGQDLIGGLDVRVERNHFGRQTESFEAPLELDFLTTKDGESARPFRGVFIRAPVVERILPVTEGAQVAEEQRGNTVVAPSKVPIDSVAKEKTGHSVRIRGSLKRSSAASVKFDESGGGDSNIESAKIVAVEQGNVFGTSFHPELSGDARIHQWWLREILPAIVERRRGGRDSE